MTNTTLSIVLTISFIFLFCSCQNENQRNNSLPNKNTLIHLISEIQIAQAAVQPLKGVTKDSVYSIYINQIAQKNGIDVDKISSILVELEDQPDYMKEIYSQAAKYLDTLDTSYKINLKK